MKNNLVAACLIIFPVVSVAEVTSTTHTSDGRVMATFSQARGGLIGFSNHSKADTLVDICNRGAIGRGISRFLDASDCAHVSSEKMRSLTYLSLSNNNITHIPDHAFVGFDSLYSLELENNKISQIPDHAFEGLNSLGQLYLGGNHIK